MNEVQIKNKYGKCVWITTNLGERSSSGCKQVFDPAIDSTIICSSLFTAMVSIVDCIVANSHWIFSHVILDILSLSKLCRKNKHTQKHVH